MNFQTLFGLKTVFFQFLALTPAFSRFGLTKNVDMTVKKCKKPSKTAQISKTLRDFA